MKIKMLTISASPDPKLNWHEGEIREVCKEEGEYWVMKGIALDIEQAIVKPSEKAVIVSTQKAVVAPPETAGDTGVTPKPEQPPVAPPVAPEWK